MRNTVETLAGPLDTAQLGTTLMHEHIVVTSPELQAAYPGFHGWRPDVEIPKAREVLRQLKEAGVDTLVDMSVIGMGRDIEIVEEVVSGSGLQVIVATGLFTYHDLLFPLKTSGPGTSCGGPEPLDDLLLRDIRDGIGGTSIKAAILKCATDAEGVVPDVERVLRACARVSRETGTPIYTHTHPVARGGLEQQQIFREEGADLERVVIGHSGDHTDLDYLERLIDAGSVLGMDRFGPSSPPSPEQRADTVAALCARGYADRMVLSHDLNCYCDWYPEGHNPVLATPEANLFLYISNVAAPALKERGVTEQQIDQMRIHTPRRLFEGR